MNASHQLLIISFSLRAFAPNYLNWCFCMSFPLVLSPQTSSTLLLSWFMVGSDEARQKISSPSPPPASALPSPSFCLSTRATLLYHYHLHHGLYSNSTILCSTITRRSKWWSRRSWNYHTAGEICNSLVWLGCCGAKSGGGGGL